MIEPLQPKAGFTRWYDVKPELSQAVRMLEKVPAVYQHQICLVIIEQVENALLDKKFDGSLKKHGSDKILGLFKSKSKRRWYDDDPVVHKAFNYMYLMDDKARYEAAMKIIISLNVLKQVLSGISQANPLQTAHIASQTIIQSIFDQPLNGLMQKTTLVPLDLSKSAAVPPSHEGKSTSNYQITNNMLVKKSSNLG